MPEYELKFISTNELWEILNRTERCTGSENRPLVTIVDYRTQHHVKGNESVPYIKTACPTIHCLLDDLADPGVRAGIPKNGLVVVVSETGNRDWAVLRYLSQQGYTNISGLQFGMRGWIKSGYPVEYK